MRYLAAAPILATLVLTACQTPKPVELPAPAADSTVVHFVGTPLSGPTLPSVGTSAPRLRPEELLGVRVTMIVLEHMPHNALEPLGAHARLIVAARGEDPVLPTTRLTLDARYGRFASLIAPGELNKVLPLAVTGRSRPVGWPAASSSRRIGNGSPQKCCRLNSQSRSL